MDEGELFEREMYQLAIHEAGHVVVAWCLGLGVEIVSIMGDEETEGRTLIIPPELDNPCQSVDKVVQRCRTLEKRVRIAFAGPLAEGKFSGESLRLIPAHNDFLQGVLLLRQIAESSAERERIGDFLLKQTQELIRRRWKSINVIATRLVANGELFSPEIEALLGERQWEFFSRRDVAFPPHIQAK